jgi:hypothetical protein
VADIHLVVGVSLLVLSLMAAIWGTIAWATNRPSVWFWYVLRAAQAVLVLQILLGGLLLATDHEAAKGEHYMYGIVALVASFIGEGMRSGAAERELPENVDFETLEKPQQREIALRIVRRETAIMTITVWFIALCVFRAAQTSGNLF